MRNSNQKFVFLTLLCIGRNAILAVTKCDEIDTDAEREILKERTKERMGVPEYRIHLMSSYTEKVKEKDFQKEKAAYGLLKEAMDQCSIYKRRMFLIFIL